MYENWVNFYRKQLGESDSKLGPQTTKRFFSELKQMLPCFRPGLLDPRHSKKMNVKRQFAEVYWRDYMMICCL